MLFFEKAINALAPASNSGRVADNGIPIPFMIECRPSGSLTPNHSDIPELTLRHDLHAFHEYRPNPPATARAQI